mmetsp:Transcript_4896/g.10821  ORF Transcript_4896/g.10821 Transcript_4896/m.10821 type:complete len:678 (+) Transcript_4896:398-2431(+)
MSMAITMTTLILAIATATTVVNAAPVDDLITDLPGWGKTPTPQYSGYLDASKGCDIETNGPVCKIHYWLAMADENEDQDQNQVDATESNPKPKAPATTKTKTVLWLNGGPGSSSLLGWLQEVGPLLLNATGGLMENPWAWNKAGVNLMAIEAPMGVGFSYCSRQLQQEDAQPCANTDTNTAEASRAALVDFFVNKFPELAEDDAEFYIAGESYAGVYIPTLAKELLTHSDSKNNVVPLKGVLVGDPCTDNAAQKDSMDSIWYSHKYGLMDNEVYDVLVSDECEDYYRTKWMEEEFVSNTYGNTNSNNNNDGTHSSKSHRSVGKQWSSHVTAAELNQELMQIEDLTERRLAAEKLYRSRILGANREQAEAEKVNDANEANRNHLRAAAKDDNDASSASPLTSTSASASPLPPAYCKLAYRKFLMSSSKALSQGWKDLYIDDYSLFAPVTSKEDEQMADYFNRPDVRQALHVTDTDASSEWPMPDVGFSYTKEYNACNWKPEMFIKYPNTTMVDVYKDILPMLDRVWIYNGDTDPCVSYEGTREAVKQILIEELDGGSYRPWFYKQEAASLEFLGEKSVLFGPDLVAQTLDEAQFAGEVTSYQSGLSFVTFHGSGHMVPQFKPQSSLHFVKQFLHSASNGAALSPLLPTNATLLGMSDEDFEQAMDDWTEAARDAMDKL